MGPDGMTDTVTIGHAVEFDVPVHFYDRSHDVDTTLTITRACGMSWGWWVSVHLIPTSRNLGHADLGAETDAWYPITARFAHASRFRTPDDAFAAALATPEVTRR